MLVLEGIKAARFIQSVWRGRLDKIRKMVEIRENRNRAIVTVQKF